MKRCDYCGRENEETLVSCPECGTPVELPQESVPPLPVPAPPLPRPRSIRPEAIAHAFVVEEGFHRADWGAVWSWIEANVPASDHHAAWSEAAGYWVSLLRSDLGSDYYVLESKSTILLCDLPMETAQWLLRYAGEVVSRIQSELPWLAWDAATTKDVVLVFSELDDYDQYLAFHLQEGAHPQSGGVCIHSGYTHLAIPWENGIDAANAIVHELSHECVAHLELPIWLNEGVAQTLQRALAPPPLPTGQGEQHAVFLAAINWRPPLMWDELAERHFAFWNEQNIHGFWAGTTFHEPGDPNELSYSLAEVLVKLLLEKGSRVVPMLQQARREDAGQNAALQVFDADLGALAATFLGPGNWRPQRKLIAERWQAAGWAPQSTTPEQDAS